MKVYKSLLLTFMLCNFGYGQNDCEKFKDYEASQSWIREVKKLNPESRKNRVLSRYFCENAATFWFYNFKLGLIIDNVPTLGLPQELSKFLTHIPAENINIEQSNCETMGLYVDRCNLGWIHLRTDDKPILNEIPFLDDFKLNEKKRKIILTFKSSEIATLKVFISAMEHELKYTETKEITTKIGDNKIKIPKDGYFTLITIQDDELSALFLK